MTIHSATERRCIQLDVNRLAARHAREFVQETLEMWDCTDLEDELTLAVSELVTNAIIHAQSVTRVTLVNHGDAIQLRVHDEISDLPKERDPTPEETSGRGILLVEALSSKWGIDTEPPGKTIWLDITRSSQ